MKKIDVKPSDFYYINNSIFSSLIVPKNLNIKIGEELIFYIKGKKKQETSIFKVYEIYELKDNKSVVIKFRKSYEQK